jgi:hypothetical protein
MRITHSTTAVAVVLVVLALGPSWSDESFCSSKGSSSAHPGDYIDLSPWTLQLPVDCGSSSCPSSCSGGICEVKDPALKTYESVYFYTSMDHMTMCVPLGAPTTADSDYPRTELAEVDDWSPKSGNHTMTAQVRVLHVPSRPEVVIGQIRESSSGTYANTLQIFWNDGNVEVRVKDKSGGMIKIPNGNAITTAPINATIKYSVNWHDYQLSVVVNGKHVSYDYSYIASDNSNLRFKAGNYCQDSSSGSDGCRVGFNILTVVNN